MTDTYRRDLKPAFQDLVPWADPYIASLVEKVRRSGSLLKGGAAGQLRNEAAPPLGTDSPDLDHPSRRIDWSHRGYWQDSE